MACTTALPQVFELLDQLDTALYVPQHLCQFIGDIACAGNADTQVDAIKTESVAVVFGWLADQIKAARAEHAQAVREEVGTYQEIVNWRKAFTKGESSC